MPNRQMLLGATGPRFSFDGSDYDLKVYNTNPIGFWPMSETAGIVAADLSGGEAPGDYLGTLTLGVTGIGDGTTAVRTTHQADGRMSVTSGAVLSSFSGDLGSAMIWTKVNADGDYDSAGNNWFVGLYDDVENYFRFESGGADSSINFDRRGGDESDSIVYDTSRSLSWICWVYTWDFAGADEIELFHDDVGVTPIGVTNTWAGSVLSYITACNNGSNGAYWGDCAKLALWDRVITASEITSVSSV